MVKMSTRVWSFILTVVMLVSSLSCIAFAQYNYEEVQSAGATYVDVAYDFLVGTTYQSEPGVYVINGNWAYDEDNQPEDVTFTFRDKEVTELYDPNRHFSSIADASKVASKSGVKIPIYIFTEGVYAFNFATRTSVIILGPKAGMDPNVRDADPTKEWALSSDRYLPDDDSQVTNGEAVFRPNATEKMIRIDNDGNVDVTLVVDGVVLQGNGAGVGDETYRNGGAVHKVYVQNCVLDNTYASGGRGGSVTFGFDMRNSQEHEKHLYLSNLYIINQNKAALYSGHATVVEMNACSYQRSTNQPFNAVASIPWQGQRTKVTNCHFWNPTGVSVISGGDTGYFLNCTWNTWCSNSKPGNDEVEFSATVKNNTFCNVGSATRPMFRVGMAGNSALKVEDNIFIDTENHASHDVFVANYIASAYNGSITRAHIGGGQTYMGVKDSTGQLVTEGYYFMDDSRIGIHNNVFIGSEYQNTINIGNNTHPDTDVQMTGNLYLDSLDSTEGNIVEPATEGAKAYNKWVWLDAAMTKKSAEIFEDDVVITSGGAALDGSGYQLFKDITAKEYTIPLEVSTNADNGVRVYKADAEWTKSDTLTGTENADHTAFTLDTSARTNYYIVSITSIDGRTERDYKITVNRAANPDAQLKDIVLEPGVNAVVEKQGDDFKVDSNYYQSDVAFKLSVSEDAKATIRQGFGLIFADANGVYTVSGLEVGQTVDCVITITGSDGLKEVFNAQFTRQPNTETALLDVDCGDANSIDRSGNTYYVELDNAVADTTLDLTVSPDAAVSMREPVYNSQVSGNNGSFKVNNIPVGENTYSVEVLAQDGINYETWYIVINRKARTECELLDIADTEKIENVYFAFTANKGYMVSASCSPGASYTVYKDADCTDAYDGTYITLTKVTTTVWLRVVAEDGLHQSAPIKLVISSYADFDQVEDGVIKLPEVVDPNYGAISIDGATFMGNTVVIPLAAETESFEFQARPRSGYDIRVMSDDTEKPMRPDETKGDNIVQITLKPDAGYTVLYATASKGDEVIPYMIVVFSPKRYTYTDTQTPWAKEYVEDIAQNGFGLMKGDQNGAFNGEKLFTRYEMAALMVRMAGANAPLYNTAKNPFSDVADSHWAINYVKAAYRLGLINGYETKDENDKVIDITYQGDKNATRSEFFRVYANTYLGFDVDEYYEMDQKAIDTFVKSLGLKDLDKVADWAKPAVYFVIYMEWVIGDQNKNVNPESNITRNEVAAVLSRNWGEMYA